MITGTVSQRQARIPVTIRIPGHPDIVIEFVVDTGFAGSLTLSSAAIAAIGLPYRDVIIANLADDTDVAVAVHTAIILWDGMELEVDVLATGSRPLIGTLLLDGHNVDIDFVRVVWLPSSICDTNHQPLATSHRF